MHAWWIRVFGYIIAETSSQKKQLRPNGNLAGTVAEKLKELCDALADMSTKSTRKAAVFVIDRLEHFADQRNQLLLYTLFDSAREQAFPICVIGLSTVLDVLEKMEKRVKSRFSQRVIAVSATLFATVEEFKKAIRFALEHRLVDSSQKSTFLFCFWEIVEISNWRFCRSIDWLIDWLIISWLVLRSIDWLARFITLSFSLQQSIIFWRIGTAASFCNASTTTEKTGTQSTYW